MQALAPPMTTTTAPTPAALDANGVSRLVYSFYDDIRAHPELGPVFDRVIQDRWGIHLPRMVQFWSTVMLGTRSFSGNVFGKHMAIDGVQPGHFSIWLTLWKKNTEALFAPEVAHEFQFVAKGIARNLYNGYFGVFPEFVDTQPEDEAAA